MSVKNYPIYTCTSFSRQFPITVIEKKDAGLDSFGKTAELSRQLFSEQGLPLINAIDKGGLLPPFYRMSGILPVDTKQSFSLDGLQNLHLSGSSQFSESSLETVIKRIRDVEGKTIPITIIDLTQENHLHVRPKIGKGALAFSALKPLPWWIGPTRTPVQIDQSEQQEATRYGHKKSLNMYMVVDSIDPKTLTKDHHTVTSQIIIHPREVMTERELVQQKGCSYIRIPDRKFGHMEWEHVDAFIEHIQHLPPESHVHFHCRRGLSRTTLFMAMYDMMKNADRVSLEDIIKRQGSLGLGGVDLDHVPDSTSWDYSFKRGWLEFLHHFHSYVSETKATNFQKSWSQWAHDKGLPVPQPVPLDETYTGPTLDVVLPPCHEVAAMREQPLVLTGLNETKVFVQNYRSMQGEYLDLRSNPNFTSVGLCSMKASGSSQYSQTSFERLVKQIKAHDPLAEVFVWDLQHYDHVFVNGMDVSRLETNAEFIQDRTADEIKRSEELLKQTILQQKGVTLRAIDTKYPSDDFDERFSMRVVPKEVLTPEELITRAGAQYRLIPTKRFSEISDDTEVDRLVDHVWTMSEHAWNHFHCKMGKSRTTLYLSMFDILHNADVVSMEAIVKRQHLMGGINLFDVTPVDPTWAYEKQGKIDRVVFLARFHEYARSVFIPAQKTGVVPQSWSEWSKEHVSFQPIVTHLVRDKTEG